MEENEYLTTEQAAEYLNVSKQFLEVARRKGRGPKFTKLVRLVRYPKHCLDEYASQNLRENTIKLAKKQRRFAVHDT